MNKVTRKLSDLKEDIKEKRSQKNSKKAMIKNQEKIEAVHEEERQKQAYNELHGTETPPKDIKEPSKFARIKRSMSSRSSKRENDDSKNNSLGLSKIDGTPAPPDFIKTNSNYQNSNDNKNIETASAVKSINKSFESMQRSGSDSNSDLEFPDRSNISKYSDKLKIIENKQRTKILEQNRQLEVMKMKNGDNVLLIDALSKMKAISTKGEFDPRAIIPHRKYLENQKQKDPFAYINRDHYNDKKPFDLFLETVDSVFDHDGNIFSRANRVKYLGNAEFRPQSAINEDFSRNKDKEPEKVSEKTKSESSRLPKNLVNNEEKRLVSEIHKYEMKKVEMGKKKPSKYFYNGKQIYPAVDFQDNTVEFKYDSQKKVAAMPSLSENTILNRDIERVIKDLAKLLNNEKK